MAIPRENACAGIPARHQRTRPTHNDYAAGATASAALNYMNFPTGLPPLMDG